MPSKISKYHMHLVTFYGTRHGTKWKCGFYSCVLPQRLAFWRRRLRWCLNWVGPPKDELRLRLRLSLVPGQTHPPSLGNRPSLHCRDGSSPATGIALATIVYNISGGGRLRHQVPVLGVALHHKQIRILHHAWVLGAPRSPPYLLFAITVEGGLRK